ncbi:MULTISPECIES: ATP-binding protein [Shewanella]|jgi:signal transduction histidine kinase|uniref:ATP-binding protein n=1 Tax=Shewanella TaxID=22 RepID=UPI000C34CF39|nr:ATP-binding protein [Shewanella indica]GHA93806.1 two-component sensor histidine kinase [Shewanella indica]
MMSIRTKLSLWLTALVLLSTLIGLAFMESMLRQAFHDSIINRLQEDLEQVALATHLNDGEILIDQSLLSGFYKPAYSGRYYQLNLPDREIRSRSLWDQRLEIVQLEPGQTRAWQTKGPQNHDIQLLSLGLTSSSKKINATLTVAQDLSIGRKVFTEVYGTKLSVNLAMLLAMILGIFLVLRQSFKPVKQIKQALAKLREGEINSLSLETIPPEVKPLAETYNELLEYTSNQIQRSRNNLGNLSHGLKTPLAVMRQQVEALGLKDPDTARALEQQLEQIHKMIERKLAAARITGDMLPAAQLVLPRDLESLCQTLDKVHRYKQISWRFDISDGIPRLPIHREDGMELLGNLLDNAYKWASSLVLVRVWQHQGLVYVSVEDDGPGVAEKNMQTLTRRGNRLDEEINGHGLGLSIVKDIAEQYQLDIDFSRSPALGGLKVSLTFKA